MNTFVTMCLAALSLCESGPISSERENFSDLSTIHHGDGATSYQNVNVENFHSVPIPKDLQVDDGHEYTDKHEILSLDQHNYVDDISPEDVIVSADVSPFEESYEKAGHFEFVTSSNDAPLSHYENYEHEMLHE